ncbi:uncharacterized protein LOC132911403 [Bombus pascuorum]|uniref:uncharacterized protein LOC132911403 n=1 Tax=Bombus pascuorum TaxID=65598 RepID=UPI00298EC172|nr:uncharacterized protein LOC132911403 [Bombus pascuorum]
MRTIVFAVCPLDNRRRPSLLIYVILAVILPIHVSAEAQKNEHGNTYVRRSNANPGLSKNTEESKVSIVDDENKDSKAKSSDGQRDEESAKSTDENSPALNKFLQDVLKAQTDLKWIDQALHDANREKDWKKNSQNVNKLREKRGFSENYETTRQLNRNTYRDENPLELSQRLRFGNDMTFKRNVDLDDVDAYEKGYRISVIKIFQQGEPGE